MQTHVFAAGRLIARQRVILGTTAGALYDIEWRNHDAFGVSDHRAAC
ncbi:MAG: hypothetical protein ACRD6X_21400 [Pyrinomonadaceae bacterium]